MVREPVVNGRFYPNTRDSLNRLIENFCENEPSKISAKGIILPHAGYVYSGKVAVRTVSKIIPKKKLVILGAKHTSLGADFSLWAKGAWNVPYGQIQIDEDLAKIILSTGNSIEEDTLAHENEHSIEVELPILQYFFKEFEFVPIVCSQSNLKMYRQIANQLFEAVKNIKEEILFVASTDLTHHEPEETARNKDRAVIEAIVNLDEEELLQKIKKMNISMCGAAPVAILLTLLKKLKAQKSQVILYQTSGEISGDLSSVVGYAGMVIK